METPMAQREGVRFASGDDRISAWLYRPSSGVAGGAAPLLVMAHGLGAVRTMRLDAYAERFSAAGYACLVFDYRNFGESEGRPRQLLDIGMQLADWAAAVAYAHTLAGIDRDRIGLWGTSFGGGHVIATAAPGAGHEGCGGPVPVYRRRRFRAHPEPVDLHACRCPGRARYRRCPYREITGDGPRGG
jgi:dienelactone hydrolase